MSSIFPLEKPKHVLVAVDLIDSLCVKYICVIYMTQY